ncbi:hypothetical protein GCM10010116_56250 [Microbispora rosea subsp. aerata]|nr:hypothetical protein GCM10010116_56250 [Microbispora rosea subsp. aerata]GIH56172.1 hypothetical protein Mro02_30860 [Microbispora rosea subsp. aerata]GLJ85737.1 hypothetical protein GCM10017588_44700 [Microbispora rosea subsp. aerata]
MLSSAGWPEAAIASRSASAFCPAIARIRSKHLVRARHFEQAQHALRRHQQMLIGVDVVRVQFASHRELQQDHGPRHRVRTQA